MPMGLCKTMAHGHGDYCERKRHNPTACANNVGGSRQRSGIGGGIGRCQLLETETVKTGHLVSGIEYASLRLAP